MSHRMSIVSTASSLSAPPGDDPGDCNEQLCSASMLTHRGRIQKTCQLVWTTLIPAIALVIYSTARFAIEISDIKSRQRTLQPNSVDVNAMETCVDVIRRVQALRTDAAMSMGTGVDVSAQDESTWIIVSSYIQASLGHTLSAIDRGRQSSSWLSGSCDFVDVMKRYDAEPRSPVRSLFLNDEDTSESQSFCSVFDYAAASIQESINSTLNVMHLGRNFSTAYDKTSMFSLTRVVELLQHDCSRLMVYTGQRSKVGTLIEIWSYLVELEEFNSMLQSIGALHFLGVNVNQWRMNLFVAAQSYDHLAATVRQEIHVRGDVDNVILSGLSEDLRNMLDDVLQLSLLANSTISTSSSSATSIIIYRWVNGIRDKLESLATASNDLLRQIDRLMIDERDEIGRSIAFAVFVWVLVFFVLGPLVLINAQRNMSAVQAYTTSFESKEAELKREKRKTEALLNEMLPRTVRLKLQRGESTLSAEQFDAATVFFSDVTDFAELSESHHPMQVITILNEIYNFMDGLIPNFDVYKVETISCVYMVVSGVPSRNGNRHVAEIARMSLNIMENARNFRIVDMPNVGLNLRIGIHTGPVVAGVVGNKMPRYCLFGDTVNTASRMQSNGMSHMIHVSEATHQCLKQSNDFNLESRGTITIKGKGNMHTYWLLGKSSSAPSNIDQTAH